MIFYFSNDKLHIGIHKATDSLEWDIFTKINKKKVEKSISKDTQLIKTIMDELIIDKNYK